MMLLLKEICATGARNVRRSSRSRRNEGFWHSSERSKNRCWNERIPQSGSQFELQSHGKIRQQCPRTGDFSLSLQQLLTVSKRKDAVCKGAGTFVPMTVKGDYFLFFPLCVLFQQWAACPQPQQSAMAFLITKGYNILQSDWICEVSSCLCQWWFALSVHKLLPAVRSWILVVLCLTQSLVSSADRYWSSPNAHVSAFLTPACVDTITSDHQTPSINAGYGCSSKSGMATGCLQGEPPFSLCTEHELCQQLHCGISPFWMLFPWKNEHKIASILVFVCVCVPARP